MKVYYFDQNDACCKFTYHRVREGPNFFISYYKNSAVGHMDPKECWRTLGCAKFTDYGKALKAWCLEMDAEYGDNNKDEEKASRADTSFASEVLKEQADDDPTANTKMIV